MIYNPYQKQFLVKLFLEFPFLYFAAALFGVSILGTILVEPWHIPWLVVSSLLSGWLIWRSVLRILVYSVMSNVLLQAIAEVVAESRND